MTLSKNEKQIVLAVIEWANRMSISNGKTVIDSNEKRFDWGQALCREQFGPNWINHMINNNIIIPTQEDLDKALDWEKGNKPDWVLGYI